VVFFGWQLGGINILGITQGVQYFLITFHNTGFCAPHPGHFPLGWGRNEMGEKGRKGHQEGDNKEAL